VGVFAYGSSRRHHRPGKNPAGSEASRLFQEMGHFQLAVAAPEFFMLALPVIFGLD
jgi:hypothetical protein